MQLLEMYGLVDAESMRKYVPSGSYDRDGAPTGTPDSPGDAYPDPVHETSLVRTRNLGSDESIEERLLRRRMRREAMVIGGEGRPFALANTRRRTIDSPADHIETPRTQSGVD